MSKVILKTKFLKTKPEAQAAGFKLLQDFITKEKPEVANVRSILQHEVDKKFATEIVLMRA